jgi:acetyl-CoA acyltransferase
MQEPSTSNLAREVALATSIPESTPAYTVTAACASANVAIHNAVDAIASGQVDVAIAGGADTLSDPPIRYRREVRKRLVAAQRVKGMTGYLKILKGLRPRDLAPDTPAIVEFSTGLSMGQTAERLARRLGITRAEQDAWAVRSHERAAAATRDGHLADQIVPVFPPPGCEPVSSDNGVREDTSLDALARLKPAFERTFGTVTAGNSSFLTDGAAAVALMSEDRARELNVKPLAAFAGRRLAAANPLDELLLGPAFATPGALDDAGLRLDEIGVLEIHEAFAAALLAAVRELKITDLDRLNAWGGSLSLGHPFGATGARLLMTACRRMAAEASRYGLVATCAAGAIGSAFVLERCE